MLVALRHSSYAVMYCSQYSALVHVREAEFPVLVRIVDALEESLSLLFLREVQEELYDSRAVAVEMALQVHDGAIALLPDGVLVEHASGSPCVRRISGCTRTISTSS